ncbi:SCP-like protein [Teladorsagia circumcincta]|uniref:SCP-like protein n=1 Tax=Teladorsagia circumcincta TaxID=45464 RepID=A0A2G9THG7_TELCI|nr:SCP-like protein [Teladorsagia circumcincta]
MLAGVSIVIITLVLATSHTEAGFCSSPSLTQTEKAREAFLGFHNDFRRSVALGLLKFAKTPNKKNTLGPAKNMYEVNWDCDLEKKAQDEISSCALPLESNLTENTLRLRYIKSDEEEVLRDVMWAWMSAPLRYGVGIAPNLFHYRIEALGNIANWKNRKIGCSYKSCGFDQQEMLIACVYDAK